MPKQRRLTDLYVVGKELSFDDGEGEPVVVFVRKLNPVDHETALRYANAARSRANAIKHKPDDEDHQILQQVVENYSRDDLVKYLVEDLRHNRLPVIEASLADEEEWKNESYLQGLNDDWNNGLSLRWAKEPEDPDAGRVRGELERYKAQVDEALNGEIADLEDSLGERDISDVRTMVLDKVLEVRASIAWLTEYRRCEVWLSVREPDRKGRYFHNRDEVDELPAEVYELLSQTYLEISVEPTEGKDSAEIPPSSPSSEPPVKPETDESSGPKSAAA